eukprot:CAMPEP_0114540246 /NCGR_PEP_ID=MMETSP0114-20121206/661_1 /TAXON_ID=31324 /ORGANISM="Goniomonas sp, Strain m" /LENGTH=726 /DNA_ID=CAMNT_0001724387 /DNA_START=208 /DNA_END=2385 /DNA_ORIENTATION=+
MSFTGRTEFRNPEEYPVEKPPNAFGTGEEARTPGVMASAYKTALEESLSSAALLTVRGRWQLLLNQRRDAKKRAAEQQTAADGSSRLPFMTPKSPKSPESDSSSSSHPSLKQIMASRKMPHLRALEVTLTGVTDAAPGTPPAIAAERAVKLRLQFEAREREQQLDELLARNHDPPLPHPGCEQRTTPFYIMKGQQPMFRKQIDPEHLHAMSVSSDIVTEIKRFWEVHLKTSGATVMALNDYRDLHMRVAKALQKNFNQTNARYLAEQDFSRDSEGNPPVLKFDNLRFMFFMLADNWNQTPDVDTYASWLYKIFRRVTRPPTQEERAKGDLTFKWLDTSSIVSIYPPELPKLQLQASETEDTLVFPRRRRSSQQPLETMILEVDEEDIESSDEEYETDDESDGDDEYATERKAQRKAARAIASKLSTRRTTEEMEQMRRKLAERKEQRQQEALAKAAAKDQPKSLRRAGSVVGKLVRGMSRRGSLKSMAAPAKESSPVSTRRRASVCVDTLGELPSFSGTRRMPLYTTPTDPSGAGTDFPAPHEGMELSAEELARAFARIDSVTKQEGDRGQAPRPTSQHGSRVASRRNSGLDESVAYAASAFATSLGGSTEEADLVTKEPAPDQDQDQDQPKGDSPKTETPPPVKHSILAAAAPASPGACVSPFQTLKYIAAACAWSAAEERRGVAYATEPGQAEAQLQGAWTGGDAHGAVLRDQRDVPTAQSPPP